MTDRSTEPAALARALKQLRRRARLSQRALARLSGIAFTTIQGLEDERRTGERAIHPSPQTLRLLARGASADPEQPSKIDEARACAEYEKLMRAAGYLDGIVGLAAGKPASVAALLGAEATVELDRILPLLAQADIAFLQHSITSAIEYLATQVSRREAEKSNHGPDHGPGHDSAATLLSSA